MSTQLAIRDEINLDLVTKDIEAMQNICTSLMKTKHYQAMGEAGVFAIVQKAKSLNINPIEALNGGFYYVQGKVGMSSEMMASLIRQSGHSVVKDAKSDNSICVLHGRRADNGDTWTISFSMEDAKRAGLAKNMYDKYPGTMLYNRAMSMLARQLFPDVIKGAGYTREELLEIKTSPMSVTEDVSQPEIVSAVQADELMEILEECDSQYQNQVLKFIKEKFNTDIYGIPSDIFDKVRSAAIKKRDEARKKAEESTIVEQAKEA